MHNPVLCMNIILFKYILDINWYLMIDNVILDVNGLLATTLISYSGDLFLMQWRAVLCPYLSSLSLHKSEIGKAIGYLRQP